MIIIITVHLYYSCNDCSGRRSDGCSDHPSFRAPK